MARYPQGVSSFIPTYQAYEPDFTTMGKMLSIKQNQYDQNWKKLNNIYSSLYFSKTSHGESQKVKDQLRNEIDFNLKRVSGLDLSLEQNVQAAQQVFQPFYQNKSLMYDMAATKNWNTAKNRALGYQNSIDPKEHGLWWEDGFLELDYKLQEFQNTPYDEIQSTGLASVNYTPYVDIGLMAGEMAKEFGDRTVSSTSKDGLYEITTTNGPAILMQPLSQLYQLRMGNDPRVQAMYKTQAYVDRKNWSQSHAGEYDGDVKAAEMAYLENEFKVLQGGVKKTNKKLKGNEESFNKMQSLLQTALQNGTASPDAEKVLRNVSSNKELVSALLNISNLEKDMVSDGSSNGNTSTGKQVIFEGNIDVLRNRVDILRANSLMMQDFNKAAYSYSQRNMKTTQKADEYKLAEFKDMLKAKSDRSIAMDKFRVESGTAVWSATKNGIEAVDVKNRNSWQSEGPIAGVTANETNLKTFVQGQISSEWKQAKPGIVQGLEIATAIGIEGSSTKHGERIANTLNRGKYENKEGIAINVHGEALTLTNVKDALNKSTNSEEFEKETGLNLSDLSTLNTELLDLMTNDETTATLINSTFQTEVDKQKVVNWRKGAIKNKILLKGIYAEKAWLRENTEKLLKKAKQSSGPLHNASFAVDPNTGRFLEEKEYYDNALEAVLEGGVANRFLNSIGLDKDYLKRYLADQRRYDKREQQLTESANKQWEKGNYLGWLKDQTESTFNTYKDWDDIFYPDNILGELLKSASVADYDDVKEAWDREWTNSRNFKEAPPSSFGTGSGISSMPASAIVTPGNQGALPTQDFYGIEGGKIGIYDDYGNVKGLSNIGGELSAESPVIFSGVGTTNEVLDDDVNTIEHQKIAKMIWEAHGDRNLYKKGEGFKVIVKPTTEISGNKAAYTIMPTKAILDNLITTGEDEEKDKMKQDFLVNGATIISDRSQFDSYAFEASTTNPIEASLKRKVKLETDGIAEDSYDIEPGYGMDFTYNNKTNQYSINHRFKAFDLETYLSTGTLMETSVPVNLVNGETLYTQFESFQTSTMPVTQAANTERVNVIRALKQRNPNITDDQIRQIFTTYNFQYNL
jgi:hypothetical protein